jgi:glutamate-ammonia-ligase adenylyltransferase
VLQVMSAALIDPFKDEGWTDAFRDLLAQLTNAPSFPRLSEDLAQMQIEVRDAAVGWYERALTP